MINNLQQRKHIPITAATACKEELSKAAATACKEAKCRRTGSTEAKNYRLAAGKLATFAPASTW